MTDNPFEPPQTGSVRSPVSVDAPRRRRAIVVGFVGMTVGLIFGNLLADYVPEPGPRVLLVIGTVIATACALVIVVYIRQLWQ